MAYCRLGLHELCCCVPLKYQSCWHWKRFPIDYILAQLAHSIIDSTTTILEHTAVPISSIPLPIQTTGDTTRRIDF